MTTIDIAEQADGFWVVKTEERAPAGQTCECRNETDLLSLMRGWNVPEDAVQKALHDLSRHGLANLDLF